MTEDIIIKTNGFGSGEGIGAGFPYGGGTSGSITFTEGYITGNGGVYIESE